MRGERRSGGAPLGFQAEQALDRRLDDIEVDHLHTQVVSALLWAAGTKLQPRNLALEERSLIPAGKIVDRDRAIGALPPELAGAAQNGRSRAEQRNSGSIDHPAHVRDARIRAHQQLRPFEQMPELRQVELARVGSIAPYGIGSRDLLVFSGACA